MLKIRVLNDLLEIKITVPNFIRKKSIFGCDKTDFFMKKVQILRCKSVKKKKKMWFLEVWGLCTFKMKESTFWAKLNKMCIF